MLQSAAILLYAFLAATRPGLPVISAVVLVEQLIAGAGTASLFVFLMRLCKGEQKATQYAFASSMMSLAVLGAGATSGFLFTRLGSTKFFVVAFLASIPGVLASLFVKLEPAPREGLSAPRGRLHRARRSSTLPRMRTRFFAAAMAALACAVATQARADVPSVPAQVASPASSAGQLSIPFERFELPNGMTVILSEDRSVPLVAVNVMVKVGSRFEKDKRSGFAHLFEHLMFMGTDRVPTGAFDTLMESEGGWNNAWTSEDRTDYFEVGPAHTLPLLLWLEADRLSSLGASMTQEKLDAQRKVVRNERRERSENKPYGKIELRLPELLYPKGHPYHHPVIGSHEDLEAATVNDVKSFFAEYYAANNLSLVVAGDFDTKAVRADIERLFGGLAKAQVPRGAPCERAVALGRRARDVGRGQHPAREDRHGVA
jgi:hypothetical protein